METRSKRFYNLSKQKQDRIRASRLSQHFHLSSGLLARFPQDDHDGQP